MHVLVSIMLILGFIFVLLFGLMSVLQDLVSRSIYQPPSEFDADGEQRQELNAPPATGGGHAVKCS